MDNHNKTADIPQISEDGMTRLQTTSGGLTGLVRDQADEKANKVFRIGDLAREFNVTLRTLRFYEDRGLLEPARSGSTRLYSADDRQRLKLILLAKRVGFSLSEIEEILKFEDQGALTPERAAKLISKFRGQIPALNAQREEVEQALRDVDETIAFLQSHL